MQRVPWQEQEKPIAQVEVEFCMVFWCEQRSNWEVLRSPGSLSFQHWGPTQGLVHADLLIYTSEVCPKPQFYF